MHTRNRFPAYGAIAAVLACLAMGLFALWNPSHSADSPAAGDPLEARRERMVREDIAPYFGDRRRIKDKQVLEAMRTVPRHEFIPKSQRHEAYSDHPVRIGSGQTISQPYIVALMTELAQVGQDDIVLEVGTGSGYQAAILAEIVKKVYTIEIIEKLAKEADERLKRLGYDNIAVKAGDGFAGWEEHAPFDAILVTAAPTYIPPPLIEQLKPGGRMVIPVGFQGEVQHLLLIEKQEDGSLIKQNVLPVYFVPFIREPREEEREEERGEEE